MDTSDVNVWFKFMPVTPITMVARRLYYFDAQLSMGEIVSRSLVPGVRTVQIWKEPIWDRRVARRISRRTGMKFVVKYDGECVFKGTPQHQR